MSKVLILAWKALCKATGYLLGLSPVILHLLHSSQIGLMDVS